MQTFASISIAGAGNVALHLGKALIAAGVKIDFIYGRSPGKAQELAALLQCETTSDPQDLQVSDLILCAVPDDVLQTLIPQLSVIAPVAATSGAADVLAFAHTLPSGVFYPLQTFSRKKAVDLASVPFFIEGSDPAFTARLAELGKRLSNTVVELSREKRLHLHLAAVFVNNFTNHLVDLAQQHLLQEQLSFDWLQPLLRETVDKLATQTAEAAQTGPARRGDEQTIAQHIALLPEHEAAIYRLLSASIQQRFNENDQL